MKLIFEGECDISCRERLRLELEPLYAESNLTLDLSGVTFIDSTVIGELIRLQKHRTGRGFAPTTVVVGPGPVRRVFDIAQLGQIFLVVPMAGPPATGEATRHAFRGLQDDAARLDGISALGS